MKIKIVCLLSLSTLLMTAVKAQSVKADKVPASVKSALQKKYPEAKGVQWEKEKGNYEANWGGRSKEDNSVQFTPGGEFIEIVNAISTSQLPASITEYIRQHYKGAKINEAGKVTGANGKTSYEVEANKKVMIFDEKGNFLKVEG